VRYVHEAREATIDADRVINGAGRIANVDALDLDAGGVRHDGIRIEVDACLRSVSNPSVWVCGDALVGSPQLSPLATYEGELVGRNIVNGSNEQPDYRTVPSCVFTVPALASVGLSGPQAEEQGLDVSVAINDMSEWLSARTYGESAAWSKVLVDNASGQIVGAHLIGHHAEDLIHLFALAMKHGISTGELENSLFAFPTFSADVKNLL
jgi:glutathione reductase (NADPH)